jgi:hypothetical protein
MKNCIVKFKSYATSFFRLPATQKETLMCKLFPHWENDYPFCAHNQGDNSLTFQSLKAC